MKSPSLKAPSVLPSPVWAMGGLRVALRSSSNKVVSSHILLTGSKHRILPSPGDNLARICLRGNPLAAEVELGVAAGVVNQDEAPARPKIIINTNDNYCLLSPEPVSFVSNVQRQNFHVPVQQPVFCPVVSPVPFVLNVRGQSQKKDGSPSLNVSTEINFVKSVFSVDHCVFAPIVPNAHNVVNAQLIGGRLQKFWQKWSLLGANPRVVSILRDGYILPFKKQTSSGKRSLIVSGYANPLRNLYLKEALHALLQKKAIEMVRVRTSLAFFNRRFIVPKPNQKWRPILDLSSLNKFLSVKTFKMETPETIRIFLQQGEWVTSLDFSDAYFHIPVHIKSRKYLRFHFQNQSYQFRALPFGLSTAPMEFTCVVKEVKLMAQSRGKRIHQYLDDWLIQAPTKQSCHQGTQSLLALCQGLGWVVNLQKSELQPKQVFEFVGYQYNLSHGLIKPTQNRWESILQKVQSIMASPKCRVRNFMSLIGLLTATEKQVPLGRLHMRPIQWHLKRHWRVPESLEKEIPVPRSLHPHLLCWTKETNVLCGCSTTRLRLPIKGFEGSV